LLTFDDGVKDHYREVTPVLVDRGIQGLFFLVTGCMEEQVVATVHKNHFLTAQLGLAEWQRRFVERAGRMGVALPAVDGEAAARTYPWDTPEAAAFKYRFNFRLPAAAREPVVAELFAEEFGAEAAFARELYVSWEEARRMQMGGMVLGGHTHRHEALAAMPAAEMERDLAECRRILDLRMLPQPQTPFSYPYGKRDSFTGAAVERLRQLDFCCAFSTEAGRNGVGADCYALQRVDCRQAAGRRRRRDGDETKKGLRGAGGPGQLRADEAGDDGDGGAAGAGDGGGGGGNHGSRAVRLSGAERPAGWLSRGWGDSH
jgi:peptidoglycan/xylan/chitin deacetylase (PgdA/CDA1 family)